LAVPVNGCKPVAAVVASICAVVNLLPITVGAPIMYPLPAPIHPVKEKNSKPAKKTKQNFLYS
jgi:hypothetical protein